MAVLGAGTLGLAVTAAVAHLSGVGAAGGARRARGRGPLRTPAAPGGRAGRLPVPPARAPGPAGAAPQPLAGPGRTRWAVGTPDRRGRRRLRLRRQRPVDRRVPGHGPAAGPGRAGRHARPGCRSTWPRCGTARWPWSGPTPTASSGPIPTVPRCAPSTWPLEVVVAARTGRLVSALYPLERFEEAIAHAGTAGRRGAVKVAFDLRPPAPEPPTARPQPKGPTP